MASKVLSLQGGLYPQPAAQSSSVPKEAVDCLMDSLQQEPQLLLDFKVKLAKRLLESLSAEEVEQVAHFFEVSTPHQGIELGGELATIKARPADARAPHHGIRGTAGGAAGGRHEHLAAAAAQPSAEARFAAAPVPPPPPPLQLSQLTDPDNVGAGLYGMPGRGALAGVGAEPQPDGRGIAPDPAAWFASLPPGMVMPAADSPATMPLQLQTASALQPQPPAAPTPTSSTVPVIHNSVKSPKSAKAGAKTDKAEQEYMSRVVILHMLPAKWDERQLCRALEDSGFVAGADFDLTMAEEGVTFALVHFRTQGCAKALCGLLRPVFQATALEGGSDRGCWPAGALAAPALPIALATYRDMLQEKRYSPPAATGATAPCSEAPVELRVASALPPAPSQPKGRAPPPPAGAVAAAAASGSHASSPPSGLAGKLPEGTTTVILQGIPFSARNLREWLAASSFGDLYDILLWWPPAEQARQEARPWPGAGGGEGLALVNFRQSSDAVRFQEMLQGLQERDRARGADEPAEPAHVGRQKPMTVELRRCPVTELLIPPVQGFSQNYEYYRYLLSCPADAQSAPFFSPESVAQYLQTKEQ